MIRPGRGTSSTRRGRRLRAALFRSLPAARPSSGRRRSPAADLVPLADEGEGEVATFTLRITGRRGAPRGAARAESVTGVLPLAGAVPDGVVRVPAPLAGCVEVHVDVDGDPIDARG